MSESQGGSKLAQWARTEHRLPAPKIDTKAMPRDKAAGITGINKERLEKMQAEVRTRMESGDWEGARPMHLVIVYAQCFEHVYGAPPALDAKGYVMAAAQVKRFVTEHFNNDLEEAVSYLRWVWVREELREKERRESGTESTPLGWRLVFGGKYILSDWRVARARGLAD